MRRRWIGSITRHRSFRGDYLSSHQRQLLTEGDHFFDADQLETTLIFSSLAKIKEAEHRELVFSFCPLMFLHIFSKTDSQLLGLFKQTP